MTKQSRRKFIYAILSGVGILALVAWIFRRPIIMKTLYAADFDSNLLSHAPSDMDAACILTSEQTEGPFFYPSPERSDITEDKQGKPFNLRLQIIRQPDCTPLANAVVDIWHCDAEGVYSGYPEEITHDVWKGYLFEERHGKIVNGRFHVDPINDASFLRGRQKTNEDGWVSFNTIFPGWYDGRVPHIHAKIYIDEVEQLTTQFYFENETCDTIYTTHEPYIKYGKASTKFKDDIALDMYDEANGLVLTTKGPLNDNSALVATAKIGIKQA
ncbi:protocatechuate 3,4-dioxygenase beta subunit [Saonia flava]|uniref:Protocatechuate 3,4-dioxygenase beta subunit n=1 Tax=Saonia flava TaxID=523696 RepID=A0A846QZE3_9FLAO|nr:hypothetical protein [Saonia flava]NJB70504.1 protocatechuate 3,4-dioxygenase beta subunit [Saonia flava]